MIIQHCIHDYKKFNQFHSAGIDNGGGKYIV